MVPEYHRARFIIHDEARGKLVAIVSNHDEGGDQGGVLPRAAREQQEATARNWAVQKGSRREPQPLSVGAGNAPQYEVARVRLPKEHPIFGQRTQAWVACEQGFHRGLVELQLFEDRVLSGLDHAGGVWRTTAAAKAEILGLRLWVYARACSAAVRLGRSRTATSDGGPERALRGGQNVTLSPLTQTKPEPEHVEARRAAEGLFEAQREQRWAGRVLVGSWSAAGTLPFEFGAEARSTLSAEGYRLVAGHVGKGGKLGIIRICQTIDFEPAKLHTLLLLFDLRVPTRRSWSAPRLEFSHRNLRAFVGKRRVLRATGGGLLASICGGLGRVCDGARGDRAWFRLLVAACHTGESETEEDADGAHRAELTEWTSRFKASPSEPDGSEIRAMLGRSMDKAPALYFTIREHSTAERSQLERLLVRARPSSSRSVAYAEQVRLLESRINRSRDGRQPEVALLALVLLSVLDESQARGSSR